MRRTALVLALAASTLAVAACVGVGGPGRQAERGMTFFVTSTNPGRGADFGGLAGADRHCQNLAAQAGAGNRTWRAYLSTPNPLVHARDRIGRGPWHNARGELIARNVEDLHDGNSGINKQTALTERGQPVSGRGDPVNMHDILTGSSPDGRAVTEPAFVDTTCSNWTSSGNGSAIVGHHDRVGLRDDAPARSWNSSHPSQGCSMEALRRTGGSGLLYCFAAN